jgi:2'-5' RNA ligase
MAKSLLVINYPTISAEDFDWIQQIREQHDPLYWSVVAPHFTVVFPVFNLEEKAFIHHVAQVAKEIEAFDFVLRCAVLGDDAFSDFTHVFLVPDEGYSKIVKLHDRLYTGILANELRLDIPFVPHIGIANSLNAQACKDLVDDLNARAFEIKGRVEKLDIIWYENDEVITINQVSLIHSDAQQA